MTKHSSRQNKHDKLGKRTRKRRRSRSDIGYDGMNNKGEESAALPSEFFLDQESKDLVGLALGDGTGMKRAGGSCTSDSAAATCEAVGCDCDSDSDSDSDRDE